ncbi:S8 family serine peptidase [Marinospirillum sp.]|uniref:S8 family serine peptidase n=1 Tax=Marinospirillum sp. TaxID=2183934 RepID=UPI00286FCFF3|nr:S8 family serine peptidase [Marinospirillum sp.]MDR9468569.1 S8 family serine peptidase [Marinospirillum sp.]
MAWKPSQVPAVIELQATESQPPRQLAGERLRTAPSADYELYRYEVVDRIQRLTLMRELRGDSRVRFVELDAVVVPQSSVSPPEHFPQLNLVDASDQLVQYPCDDFPIAIVDTGINWEHPALDHANLSFDFKKNYIDEDTTAEDDNGHGSHIAGLIAAQPTEVKDQEGNLVGNAAGICSSAVLHTMKTLESDSKGYLSDINTALLDALEKNAEENYSFPIINTSLVASTGRSTLEGVLGDLSDRGQFVIAAAGNDSRLIDTQPRYPAAFSNELPLVISVGNADADNQLASSSNYGYQQVDLAAPGVSLFSTWLDENYATSTGTSMSTPLVAATLAALTQKYQADNLPAIAYRAALLNTLALNQEALEGKLRYPGVLDTGSAMTASKEELFKPAWVNFEWIDGAEALYLKGYRLNEVETITFHQEEKTSVQLDDWSYDEDRKALQIALPEEWLEGRLQLTTKNDGNLHPLDFTLMAGGALPADTTLCEADTCRIAWQDYNVDVTRRDGNEEVTWWLSTRKVNNEEVLVITGVDLSANWEFYFSGHPRLRLMDMQADKAGQGFRSLTDEDGYSTSSQGYSGSWLVAQPQDWSVLEPPFQQLVLRPDVRLTSGSSGAVECYIATSVYGNVYAPEVEALRDFRDEVLMETVPGRWLVDQYYTYSPAVAEWMDDKPRLQAVVRWGLDRFVSFWQWLTH